MRRLLVLALLALLALPAAALDRNALTFTRYDLRLTLDPHQHSLAAEGAVELRNDSRIAQREAVLQLSSSLRWLAILAEGSQVEWLSQDYTSDIDHTGALSEAIVKFEQPLAPGASIRLNIRYSGAIQKDTTRLERIGTPAAIARRSDWDQIGDNFTALRGVGFVVWYPVSIDAANLAQGNELFEALRNWRERERTSVLHIQLSRLAPPEGDEPSSAFITNGSESKSADQLTTEFRDVDPVIVLLNDPAQTTDRPRVLAYYSAAHTNFARDYMAAAETVIPPLEEWFGTPGSKVVLVELTDPEALPYDAGPFYFVPMRAVPHAAAEVALARPVVHSRLESSRPWIREGLAGFAQALIRERQSGRRAAVAYLGQFSHALSLAELQSHAPAADAASSQPPAIGLQPLITTSDEMFFRTKAAYVWWMLRDILGDRPLQTALAQYRATDDRDSAYMQRLIEKQLTPRRDLETFFDDWVYRDRGLPQLRVESAYVRQTLGQQTVTAITIENLGDAWCEVPVAIRSRGGESSVRVIVPAHGKGIIRIPFESTPSEAEVNDGSIPESERRDNISPVTVSPVKSPPITEPPTPRPSTAPVVPGPLH